MDKNNVQFTMRFDYPVSIPASEIEGDPHALRPLGEAVQKYLAEKFKDTEFNVTGYPKSVGDVIVENDTVTVTVRCTADKGLATTFEQAKTFESLDDIAAFFKDKVNEIQKKISDTEYGNQNLVVAAVQAPTMSNVPMTYDLDPAKGNNKFEEFKEDVKAYLGDPVAEELQARRYFGDRIVDAFKEKGYRIVAFATESSENPAQIAYEHDYEGGTDVFYTNSDFVKLDPSMRYSLDALCNPYASYEPHDTTDHTAEYDDIRNIWLSLWEEATVEKATAEMTEKFGKKLIDKLDARGICAYYDPKTEGNYILALGHVPCGDDMHNILTITSADTAETVIERVEKYYKQRDANLAEEFTTQKIVDICEPRNLCYDDSVDWWGIFDNPQVFHTISFEDSTLTVTAELMFEGEVSEAVVKGLREIAKSDPKEIAQELFVVGNFDTDGILYEAKSKGDHEFTAQEHIDCVTEFVHEVKEALAEVKARYPDLVPAEKEQKKAAKTDVER